MTEIILEDVKTALGIIPDNLGFDSELLIHVNSAKSILVQLGVAELDIPVGPSTEWPTFPSDLVESLTQHYMYAKVKLTFDPSASETISRTISSSVTQLEGRIAHEIAEVIDAG